MRVVILTILLALLLGCGGHGRKTQLVDARPRGCTVEGKVRAEGTGRPIAGVSVLVGETGDMDTTDAAGYYRIRTAYQTSCMLGFAHADFVNVWFMDIALSPDSTVTRNFDMTERLYCWTTSLNAPNFLGPDQLKDTAALGAGQPRDCSDSAQATHPSIILADSESFPKKYWMAYSPVTSCRGAGDENPRIVCSDDGINWGCEVAPGRTIENPIFTVADIHSSVNYLSDPELFWIDNETMGLIFRARFGIQVADSVALFLSQSIDGINWTDPKLVLVDREVGVGESPLMSPAVYMGIDDQYTMLIVDGKIGLGRISTVLKYESRFPDSAWMLVDSFAFDSLSNLASDKMQAIWHLEVVPIGKGNLLGLFTMCDLVSYGQNATLYLGSSYDNGLNWEASRYPILRPGSDSWDSEAIYRSSGYVNPGEPSDTLYVYYSALGGPSKTWHIGITTLLVDSPL